MDKYKYRRSLQLMMIFCIWSLLVLMWGYIWYEYFSDIIDFPFYRRGNWAIIGIYGILLYIITSFYGGYRMNDSLRGDLIFSGILSLTITNAITYVQICLIVRRMLINEYLIIFAIMTCIGYVIIWIWSSLSLKLYRHINPPRHLLFIYSGEDQARNIILKMSLRDDKYIIKEAVSTELGLAHILERISEYESIFLCDIKSTYRNTLLKYCYQHNIRVYMNPKIGDILVRGALDVNLFDTPILLSRNHGIEFEQRMFKRIFDIAVSFIGLLILSPVMLITALCIKLYDKGPVFYTQQRLTNNARVFWLIKFRSMVQGAEKQTGAVLSTKNDSRVTPIGRFIRATRIDELPQLWNVLKGDMSIVGPRPERPEIAEEYKKNMPEFEFRLKARAGLTGLAQVHGKYNTTPYDKLKLDLIYITTYSFLLDIKLVLQTIKVVFVKESSEGVSTEEQIFKS